MKEWLTARELAAEKLPDMPKTERGMQMFAEREGWDGSIAYVRERQGRGGGFEYHVAMLPPLARIEYERRHRSIEAAPPTAAPDQQLGSGLSDRAARERDARLAIIAAFEAFQRGHRMTVEAVAHLFCQQYTAGTFKIDAWIRDLIPSISTRTLHRWRAAKFLGRADRLAVDKSAARKGKGLLETAEDGKLRTFILALMAHNSHLSAKNIKKLCRDEFSDEISVGDKRISLKDLPIRTLQLFMATLRQTEEVALTKLSNPDKYRSHMAPSGVGTYRWLDGKPCELWMIDASPVDALCIDGRHSIYAAIDIGTRRTLLYVSRTPRAAAVALLIRKGIIGWGVPVQIKTDNGSDFKAEATVRLFHSLNVDPIISHAYSPAEKGHVERVIKTFQHDCGPLLPGFVGHSVADRKAIEDRKSFAQRLGEDTAETFSVSMTGAQLQAYVDDWIDKIYQHQVHSALNGCSPWQVAQASDAAIRTVDTTALDVLLMPIPGGDGIRVVTKTGVRVDGYHYVVNACLPRDRVLVRQDPNDVGRVLCFDAETGRFRGEGICPELRGIAASTVTAAKREAQTEILKEKTAEAKRMIKDVTTGAPLIERVLRVAARDMPNVVALPKREIAHETPAIAAALDAMSPKSDPAPLIGRAAEIHAAMKAEPAVPPPAPANVKPLRTQPTRQQQFRRWLELDRAIKSGAEIPTEDAVWYGSFAQTADWRAMRAVYEDGGEKVLR